MTAPIAAFVRPLPEAPQASAHDNASQSATEAANNGGFRTALETAMKDKAPAAAPRRTERARREGASARETSERTSPLSVSEGEAGTNANAPATADSLGTGGTDKSVAESFAAIVGTLTQDVSEEQDNTRPSGEHAPKNGMSPSPSVPQSPDGGAWMRASVVVKETDSKNADSKSAESKRAADTDDGVDLSPHMDLATATQQFVETTIGDLAAQVGMAHTPVGANAAAALASGGTLAANANGATAPTTPDDPNAVRRSVDAISPDLRTRLDRVFARMKSEFGYSVEVVETVRSQARQDQLFAQGRTAPGDVVTWTRNSKHTQGRAVDVMIDGSYDNTTAYRDLAQVAREEGLRSLWPRDGGHLELPANASRADAGATAPSLDGESHQTARDTTPAIPVQTRAALAPSPSTGFAPGTKPTDINDSSPLIPKLPTIPSSASEIILPHAAKAPEVHEPLGVKLEQQGRGGTSQADSPAQDSSESAARLTRQAGADAQSGARAGARTAAMARVAAVAGVAQVARVAEVAQVARVAQVAQPAQVSEVSHTASVARDTQAAATSVAVHQGRMALDGADGSRAGTSSVNVPASATGNGTIASATTSGTSQHGTGSNDAQQRGAMDKRERSRDGSTPAVASTTDGARHLSTREMAANTLKDSALSASDSVGSLARSDATERIARVLKMQEAAGDRPLSSVLLRLDAPDGSQDRVRIDLRGSTVGASFDVSDARAADNLRIHANELQQALQRQGLEGDSITVRTTQRSTGPVSASASALAAEREGGRIGSTAASDGGGSTAKDSRNQPRADDWREGASQQRSRQQRRDPKENR